MKLLNSGDPFSVLKHVMYELQHKKIEETWESDIEEAEAQLEICERRARETGIRGDELVVQRCKKFVGKRAKYAREYREKIVKSLQRVQNKEQKKFELTANDKRLLRSLRISWDEKEDEDIEC